MLVTTKLKIWHQCWINVTVVFISCILYSLLFFQCFVYYRHLCYQHLLCHTLYQYLSEFLKKHSISATSCFRETFPATIPNAVVSCTQGNITCTVQCNSGHVFSDGNTTREYSCTGFNVWTPYHSLVTHVFVSSQCTWTCTIIRGHLTFKTRVLKVQ